MNPEKWSALLECQQEHGVYHPALGEQYLKKFFEYAPSDRFKRVLRIGHGEGMSEIGSLKAHGYEVTTVTIQPWQKGIQMDMHDLRFPPDTFDAVYGVQSLEHAYAPWLALLEFWTVLRPSGVLYFVVPHESLHHVFTHPNLLSEFQWVDALGFCGFNVVDHYTGRYKVECACEDDFGNPKGKTAHHDVSCITVVGEKAKPKDDQLWTVLEMLREIHARTNIDPPVGVR